MILSRPKTRTVSSFTIFLLLTLIVMIMNGLAIIGNPRPAWYNYVAIGLLLPIFILVCYRIFIRYKIIRLGNNCLEVSYPVMGKIKKYPLDQIQYWVENQVKTGKNSVYKELEIKLEDGLKITAGHDEFTEYSKMVQYLQQKAPRKRR